MKKNLSENQITIVHDYRRYYLLVYLCELYKDKILKNENKQNEIQTLKSRIEQIKSMKKTFFERRKYKLEIQSLEVEIDEIHLDGISVVLRNLWLLLKVYFEVHGEFSIIESRVENLLKSICNNAEDINSQMLELQAIIYDETIIRTSDETTRNQFYVFHKQIKATENQIAKKK